MAGRIRKEIKQRKPFAGPGEEAYINLLRTSDLMVRGLEQVLKPAGLSPTQYNVLRILRGAGPAGLACRSVGDRMVTHDPDITRLLDRLEKRGLVRRTRESRDRRVITTRITPAGLGILKGLDAPIEREHERMLGHLGRRRLRALIDLLERARERS